MGSGKLPTRSDGFVMDDQWLNDMRSAICGDIVPRTTGTPTSGVGSLGAASYAFLKAFIGQGYWDTGDIKFHHSFNGTVSAGEGWMLCDGRTISLANYDTEHGAGHWATYVGSSALNGLKLPDFTGRYPVGVAATTQDGSGAITPVGNTSHQVNMRHRHQWFKHVGNNALPDKTFDVDGAGLAFSGSSGSGTTTWNAVAAAAAQSQDAYTSLPDSSAPLSTTQSIQPESIEFQVYMRII